ncbi:MAG: alpha/beta hydrolase [Bacteroidia bacterium]|nr:alpha/beta hydrolase [Bacteroidia bacterium]
MALGDRMPAIRERLKKRPVRRFATEKFIKAALGVLNRTQIEGRHILSREEVDERMTSYKSRFVEIDGYRIHYRDEGSGEGLPIVLLHGMAASLFVWNDWVRILSTRHRVIRLDMPGFALSDPIKPQTEIGVPFFVDKIEKFLRALGIQECNLVGNSLGGWIAWEFSTYFPDMVNKLTLLNAAGYVTRETRPPSVGILSSPKIMHLVRTGVPKMLVKMLIRQSYGDPKKLKKEFVERHYTLTNREGNLASLFRIANTEISPDSERIQTVQIPTLIMWGSKDRVIDIKDAHRFAKDIPHNKLVIYEKVGHIPMVEIPEQSAADLEAFLSNGLTSDTLARAKG